MKSWQITYNNLCFGIVARNDVVIKAAPVANWSIGKRIESVLTYYHLKGADIWEVV